MDKLSKNIRLMDSRIKDSHKMKRDGATIEVNYLHEAEELMRALIARNAYDAVDMESIWTKENGYLFYVSVWWN